jgi:hypothetical protein
MGRSQVSVRDVARLRRIAYFDFVLTRHAAHRSFA